MMIALLLSAALAAQPAARPAPPPDVDQWVELAMRTFEVPGLALAIVKDDDVVLAKGYGVRKLGETTPVDARTLFGIASNTKASPRPRSACSSRKARSPGTRRSSATFRRSRCGIRS